MFLTSKFRASALALVATLLLSACGASGPKLTEHTSVYAGKITVNDGRGGEFTQQNLAVCEKVAANPELLEASTGLYGYHAQDPRWEVITPTTPGFQKHVGPEVFNNKATPLACPVEGGGYALPFINGKVSCAPYAVPSENGSHDIRCHQTDFTKPGKFLNYGIAGILGAGTGYLLNQQLGIVSDEEALGLGAAIGLGGGFLNEKCNINGNCSHIGQRFKPGQ